MRRGPKPQYDPKIHNQLIHWMCRSGLTDEEIAGEIGISTRQLYRWYKDYPELCQSKKQGKSFADYQVEDSLFKRATGYEVEEAEVVVTKDGRPARIKKTKKHIAPDVTACIWWLKNRCPQKWRDRVETVHSTDNLLTEVLSQAWGQKLEK